MLRINDKDYSITFATYFNVEWKERRLFVDEVTRSQYSCYNEPKL